MNKIEKRFKNTNLKTKFVYIKEKIDEIKKDKRIDYRDKGREMAKILIKEYNIKYPFPLVEFVKKFEVQITFKDKVDIMKEIKNKKEQSKEEEPWGIFLPDKNEIQISKNIKTLRSKRFTAAHEIAHIFVDSEIKNDKIFFHNDTYYRYVNNRREVLYNDFAANLLVIEAAIDPDKFLNSIKYNNQITLARAYQVPIQTIAILAERLELIRKSNDLIFKGSEL